MAEPPTRRPRRDDDEEARYWAEEEAAHADDEYQAQLAADQLAADRESAIETMTGWFEEIFEDPQNQTPVDSEDGVYVYINGGPFDAGDAIGSQFASEFDQEWIEAAVEHVTRAGTFEWAPVPGGDFYDPPDEEQVSEGAEGDVGASEQRVPVGFFPPDPATGRADTIGRIADRLDRIESQLSELWAAPPPTGYNQPPDTVGLPPYDGEDRRELEVAITITREEIARDEPEAARLERAESTFRKVSVAILKWLGRKADLTADESIKAGIAVAKWGAVATLAGGLAADIVQLIASIIPF